MGCNHPAKAMSFDDMVRWYLMIYIVKLFLLTNKQVPAVRFNRLCAWCCTQHLTHTDTGNYCKLFPLAPTRFDRTWACAQENEFDELLFPRAAYAWFDPSCCWTKIAPPVPTCNSPFTHNSCVMSTICHKVNI